MVEVEVTADSTVEADAGEEIVLRLPQNATTGYVWTIESLAEGLLLVADTVEDPPASAPGAGGTRVLRLRAVGPTGGEVVLDLRRPWESEPLQRRVVTVSVRR